MSVLADMAGCRCPACGATLPFWPMLRTQRYKKTLLGSPRFVICGRCHGKARLKGEPWAQWRRVMSVLLPLMVLGGAAALGLGLYAVRAAPGNAAGVSVVLGMALLSLIEIAIFMIVIIRVLGIEPYPGDASEQARRVAPAREQH